MSFYVTLPSNTSPKIFPNNKPGHFFVKLPQSLELSSQYEVGLAEIQFPNSYFNILEDDIWIKYTPPKDSNKETHTIILPAGVYKTGEDFIHALNLQLLELEAGGDAILRIHYNKYTKMAVLKLYEKGAQVVICELLRSILGLTTECLTNTDIPLVGAHEVNIDSEMSNVYVYCDIVAARPVGDVMVPLLRTVPIMDRVSASVFRIYDKPHYTPMSRFSFDTVEILLTTDTGKTIPFMTGSSVVTLHFRTRRHFNLE